jgi:NTE family protein
MRAGWQPIAERARQTAGSARPERSAACQSGARPRTDATRVAIAGQGGGSHAAFTAGVLQGLLEEPDDGLRVVALSGTSGGAISALLAWDGLLRGDPERSIDQLQRFWKDNIASSLLDAFLNYSIQMAIHFRSVVAVPELSPYCFPSWGQMQQRAMLERRVDFDEVRDLAARADAPGLVVLQF